MPKVIIQLENDISTDDIRGRYATVLPSETPQFVSQTGLISTRLRAKESPAGSIIVGGGLVVISREQACSALKGYEVARWRNHRARIFLQTASTWA